MGSAEMMARWLALLLVTAAVRAVVIDQPNMVPLGEDDEAEDFIDVVHGPRAGMPADVFLSTNERESLIANPVAPVIGQDVQVPPVIQLEGGGQMHIGPHVQVNTVGGSVYVRKGSKFVVSQFAKVISE